jgi:hypothetical protein
MGKLLSMILFSITEGMSQHFGLWTLKRNKWNTVSRNHSNITALCRKTRGEGTPPAAEENFCDELWYAVENQVVQTYNIHDL